MIGLIQLYRHSLSALVGAHCRHMPTCSVYGIEAIRRHGAWIGGWMTLGRVLRCRPGGTHGLDEVPDLVRPRPLAPWTHLKGASASDERVESDR